MPTRAEPAPSGAEHHGFEVIFGSRRPGAEVHTDLVKGPWALAREKRANNMSES